ncbi:MAG TPA: PQQ-dependent sugar dehydrogenase [Chitinophagaceae bacterium]|jgi:glucose/arabinose dehydrogenase
MRFSFLSRKQSGCVYITILLLHFLFIASAQPAISFTPVVTSGLNTPVYVTNAGDSSNRLFIVEKDGVIKIYDGNSMIATPFLDVRQLVSTLGERGLLSIAFHPQYKTNRYFFIYYTNLSGDITIARYQTRADNSNVADSSSGVVLLNIPKPYANHNGGTLAFGKDGYLYFATGDGGGAGDINNNAQNGNSLLGKMIRINVTISTSPPYYIIPTDNPFVNDTTVKDEIWDLGLRNPFRWSFDRLTGDIWIGDVGQSSREEVDFEPDSSKGGNNYGWHCYEGNLPYNTTGCLSQNSYKFPIFNYGRSSANGGSTVIGGMVYRGSDYPFLYGYYICADHFSGNGWLITPNGSNGWNVTLQAGLPTSIASFGEAENGELYATSLNDTLYQVKAEEILPVRLTYWHAQLQNNNVTLSWETAFEQNLQQFDIEYSTGDLKFKKLATITATNKPSGSAYNYSYDVKAVTKFFYRLKMVDRDGALQYSNIISITANGINQNFILPNVINDRVLNIQLNEPFSDLNMYSTDGKKIFHQALAGRTGRLNVILPPLSAGIYFIQLCSRNSKIAQKIVVR